MWQTPKKLNKVPLNNNGILTRLGNMPKEGQKSVTIPEWVWKEAEDFYEANKDELKYRNITSTTGWIVSLILKRLAVGTPSE